MQPQSVSAGEAAFIVRGAWQLANCGVEEKLCEGCFSLRKVVGTANLANPADFLTKYLAGNTLRQHLEALEVWQEARRAELAPKVSAEVEAWLASPHKRRVGGAVRT